MKLSNQSIQQKINARIHKNPRALALYILNEFYLNDILLDNLMMRVFDQISVFDQRDRALIHSLVYGVIRWQYNLDNNIIQLSHREISKISLPVLNTVRMALFQMTFMDRIPDHAAVDSSVSLVHLFAPNYIARFVNGILREMIRSKKKIHWPNESTQIAEYLSLKYSYPLWIIHRWLDLWGMNVTKELCIAGNIIPPIILRTNTLKTERSNLIKKLNDSAQRIDKTFHTPDGICLTNLKFAIGSSDLFQEGLFQVQDEASQLIGIIVSPQPGETILDACAGRGGKTGHLAQSMNNFGSILAVDRSTYKLGILSEEMKRLGVSIVSTCQHRWKSELKDRLFDRVLLDAPCSSLGVIRRHPDMKWKKTQSHILKNAQRQKQLIQITSRQVRPKGRLIYSVCSLEPEETYQVVEYFLSQNKNFIINKHSHSILTNFIDKNGFYYFRPDIHCMDGFFAVCLTRVE
jgi:16S rRNA (cytosine967-C5)-methyltransferase